MRTPRPRRCSAKPSTSAGQVLGPETMRSPISEQPRHDTGASWPARRRQTLVSGGVRDASLVARRRPLAHAQRGAKRRPRTGAAATLRRGVALDGSGVATTWAIRRRTWDARAFAPSARRCCFASAGARKPWRRRRPPLSRCSGSRKLTLVRPWSRPRAARANAGRDGRPARRSGRSPQRSTTSRHSGPTILSAQRLRASWARAHAPAAVPRTGNDSSSACRSIGLGLADREVVAALNGFSLPEPRDRSLEGVKKSLLIVQTFRSARQAGLKACTTAYRPLGLDGTLSAMAKSDGAGLAPHLDLASPRGACDRGKGVHASGRITWVLHGRATSRRGLGVVWPEKDPSMTRARALKQVIRARAAKTGERYTTARRHVLKDLQHPTDPSLVPGQRRATSGRRQFQRQCSDAKALEKTGHGLDHWLDALDWFGAVEKGHTAAARHLMMLITSTAGMRRASPSRTNGRAECGRSTSDATGDEVSVSKVVAAGTSDVIKVLTKGASGGGGGRRRCAPRKRALGLVDGPASKGSWSGPMARPLSLQVGRHDRAAVPAAKTGNKVSVVVANTKLPGAATVEERREQWRSALKAVAALLGRLNRRSTTSLTVDDSGAQPASGYGQAVTTRGLCDACPCSCTTTGTLPPGGPMKVTCVIRYEIDTFQRAEAFEQYAPELGTHHPPLRRPPGRVFSSS